MKKYIIAASRGRDRTKPGHRGRTNENYEQRLELGGGAVTNTITSVQKDNYVIEVGVEVYESMH